MHLLFDVEILYTKYFAFPRNPEYFDAIEDPIDMSQIEKKIITGQFTTVKAFDYDFEKLFRNVEVGFDYLNIS